MPFDLNSYSKSMEFSLFQEFNKLPTLRLIHVSDVKKHQIKTDDLKCPWKKSFLKAMRFFCVFYKINMDFFCSKLKESN